jgi:membrane dipeptidase
MNQTQALHLHQKHPVVLIHDHEPLTDDMEKMKAARISGKVMLATLDMVMGKPLRGEIVPDGGWAAYAEGYFRQALDDIATHPDRLMLARTADDLIRAHAEDKIGIVLGSEGGKLLEASIEKLHHFYQMGMRWLQLNWAFENELCGAQSRPPGIGLKPFGRDVIREMNRLGMIIDLEHSSQRGFYDVLELSKHPVVFSHCGCRAIEPTGATFWGCILEDNDLRAIAKNGGLVGINFYPYVFRKPPDGVTLGTVLDHFDHFVNLIGADHLALGCDYFPDYGDWAEMQAAQNQYPVKFVIEKKDLALVTTKLLERGYAEPDIAKILGGNFLRVCRNVFGR